MELIRCAPPFGLKGGRLISRRWICCQLGAREHYAIPRVLNNSGRLDSLYTDLWAGTGFWKLAKVTHSKALRSLAGRFHQELKGFQVVSWNSSALFWDAKVRRGSKAANSLSKYLAYVEVGKSFATAVRGSIRSRKIKADSIVFAYDTGALEIFEWCRENGIKCVMNQMDPNRLEMELVQQEESLWPGWALQRTEIPEDYVRRREKEWLLADKVVVNSEFSRRSLVQQGVSPEKLIVVPLSFEPDRRDNINGGRREPTTLRVLWLGQVILRKGIQYLIQAAKYLKGENFHFDIVGPIGISDEALASAPSNMTFHGRVTRDHAAAWYGRSDLFVLPTISDGFAITQLEAMAYGLPVVTTPCCGDVVSDGTDGFVVPPRDASALAHTLRRYLEEPGLLEKQRVSALAKSKQFTQERLATNLLSLENALTAG